MSRLYRLKCRRKADLIRGMEFPLEVYQPKEHIDWESRELHNSPNHRVRKWQVIDLHKPLEGKVLDLKILQSFCEQMHRIFLLNFHQDLRPLTRHMQKLITCQQVQLARKG